jgi:hypothetical protein
VQLDAFAVLHNITSLSFLKVDVEGHDVLVMEGADNLFKSKIVRRAVIEITAARWFLSFERGISIYEKIMSYGYAAVCVTERKGNIDWAVMKKDISVGGFRHAVEKGLCVDWEFWIRDDIHKHT